ncbi:MFS transporter [Pararhodobacter sp. SW119]|uniref:MFS transporter n=1 Tax=Pararhodobacter sp. SW119 TaxID=2780075 RepID=UPI001ADF640E|nr:MFS transporter [Pararhodobacter sp. SW119]
MKLGIAFLVVGYLFSQFYRAFLAVLSPVLGVDLGAGADDLALSSGLWFLSFALMQLPVGWALDTLGPRRTSAWLLGVAGGGGALIFALAQSPLHLHIAMVLIGMGCSPVLMATYYIFGRIYSARAFATLAGTVIGVGTLGNILGAWPLAWAAETFGWRETVMGLAAVTLASGVALGFLVQDPPALEDDGNGRGSLLDVLRIPGLWLILPLIFVNYAPAAGLRGLWVGPYYADVYQAGSVAIGHVTLLMAFAMVLGAIAYGPLDRILGTRKGVALGGNLICVACLLALWAFPTAGFWTSALLLAAVGMVGLSFPLMMAHGRSFIPARVLGRGVTLLNLFSIGGVGIMQMVSARIHAATPATPVEAPYAAIYLFFALSLLAGCAVYAFSRDRLD